jgi:pyruvate-ferredoxin/flavodoxin oxidoreductase
VETGYWPLYRYDPRLRDEGKNPLQIDSKPPKVPLEDYVYNENRYRMLQKSNPAVAAQLLKQAKESVKEQWNILGRLAAPDAAANANGPARTETMAAASGNPRSETQRKED